jgi:O-antigen biosynthesis protein WbqV
MMPDRPISTVGSSLANRISFSRSPGRMPVKIVDLAERMIRLSGLDPGIDIEILFTGMRPGERLNEILFASEEPPVEIGGAGIMAAKPNEPPMQTLCKWLAALEEAIARDDRSTIRAVLKDAVPEFGSNAA